MKISQTMKFIPTFLYFLIIGASSISAAPALSIEKDDHIVLIGNGLGSRMMQYGFFESALHLEHPKKQPFIRNMCDDQASALTLLEKFKGELTAFIQHTLAQKYNGSSTPQLALVSPIAFEDSTSAHGIKVNKNLALYTAAMAEVAKTNNVLFVDLLTPSKTWFSQSASPLTHSPRDGLAPPRLPAPLGLVVDFHQPRLIDPGIDLRGGK